MNQTRGYSALSTKREVADFNPRRKSLGIYNNSSGGYALIYLEDAPWPVVNLFPGAFFSMSEIEDHYYGKVFAYDSAGVAVIYVTEISD